MKLRTLKKHNRAVAWLIKRARRERSPLSARAIYRAQMPRVRFQSMEMAIKGITSLGEAMRLATFTSAQIVRTFSKEERRKILEG